MINKKFYDININLALNLEIFHFDDFDNNIDWLCKKALTLNSYDHQLILYTKAANLCEKFHSYFHFEQSFFHLIYANLLFENKVFIEAIEHYKHAIFQDHLNIMAHIRLLKCCEITDQEENYKLHLSYAKQLNINFNNQQEYLRPFKNFIEYLKFATNSKFLNVNLDEEQMAILLQNNNNFWLNWNKFVQSNKIENLKFTINLIKKAHDNYHQNAAKIYFNRAQIFKELNKLELSENDIVKAQNLWAMIGIQN